MSSAAPALRSLLFQRFGLEMHLEVIFDVLAHMLLGRGGQIWGGHVAMIRGQTRGRHALFAPLPMIGCGS
ncbi:hypothetical protein [Pararhizobium sp. PWRC1-1]|uniref:hypothetical protein n=1 Tax=Pararhizobium sp. PWRC1-1 TaxID=2804566 RepID=UPI003CE71F5A